MTSSFFNPVIMSSTTSYKILKSADLLSNPTGTDIIFISEFFDAHFPFEVAISLLLFIPSTNASFAFGSELDIFLLFMSLTNLLFLSTAMIDAPALNHVDAIAVPTNPIPYIDNFLVPSLILLGNSCICF